MGLCNLAVLLLQGRGVEKDPAQGIALLTRAATEGSAFAKYRLAACYQAGEGVPQDYVQCVHWYRQAAEQGHGPSINNLADKYENGLGVAQDLAKAFELYSVAAEMDIIAAWYSLGRMYEDGRGVEQDKSKARSWLEKAAHVRLLGLRREARRPSLANSGVASPSLEDSRCDSSPSCGSPSCCQGCAWVEEQRQSARRQQAERASSKRSARVRWPPCARPWSRTGRSRTCFAWCRPQALLPRGDRPHDGDQAQAARHGGAAARVRRRPEPAPGRRGVSLVGGDRVWTTTAPTRSRCCSRKGRIQRRSTPAAPPSTALPRSTPRPPATPSPSCWRRPPASGAPTAAAGRRSIPPPPAPTPP